MENYLENLESVLPAEVIAARDQFLSLYYSSLESVSPTLIKSVELLKQQQGKQIRPLLLILIGNSYGPVTPELLNGAVFIELLHVSSLIHDDVVDESDERRGQPSMNAIFGNRKAVLIGDYVLASAMARAILTNNHQVLFKLSSLGQYLAEGELMQMDTAELGDYSEERYYEIVKRKTASLMEASMQIGAVLAGEKDHEKIKRIGEAAILMGTAFQIRDDIFDYQPTKDLGKPVGLDLKEHKVTLPLIYALEKPTKEAEKVRKLLRHTELSNKEIAYIVDFAIRSGGIEYAEQKMTQMIDRAKEILGEVIAPGESLEALYFLADYIIHRKK